LFAAMGGVGGIDGCKASPPRPWGGGPKGRNVGEPVSQKPPHRPPAGRTTPKETGRRRVLFLRSGYIRVDPPALARMKAVHPVSETMRATLALSEGGSALDPGEQDLFAYIISGTLKEPWWVCSPDMGSMKFAFTHGILDQILSLEEVADRVGPVLNPGSELTSRLSGCHKSGRRRCWGTCRTLRRVRPCSHTNRRPATRPSGLGGEEPALP